MTHQARKLLLSQISPIFNHILQFFAEIWQKNRQNLAKNPALMSYPYPTVIEKYVSI